MDIRIIIIFSILSCLISCRCFETETTKHFDPDKFAEIVVGATKEEVIEQLGEPFEKIAHVEFLDGKTDGVDEIDLLKLKKDCKITGYSWHYSKPLRSKCDFVQKIVLFDPNYLVAETQSIETD